MNADRMADFIGPSNTLIPRSDDPAERAALARDVAFRVAGFALADRLTDFGFTLTIFFADLPRAVIVDQAVFGLTARRTAGFRTAAFFAAGFLAAFLAAGFLAAAFFAAGFLAAFFAAGFLAAFFAAGFFAAFLAAGFLAAFFAAGFLAAFLAAFFAAGFLVAFFAAGFLAAVRLVVALARTVLATVSDVVVVAIVFSTFSTPVIFCTISFTPAPHVTIDSIFETISSLQLIHRIIRQNLYSTQTFQKRRCADAMNSTALSRQQLYRPPIPHERPPAIAAM
jgi:hypothetical protein